MATRKKTARKKVSGTKKKESSLQIAKRLYKSALVKYKAGKATQADVEKRRKRISELECKVNK